MTITLTKPKTQLIWRSPDPGAKTTSIPGSVIGNKGYELDIKTMLNNGDTHTVTPTSGTIGGATNFTFTDDNCNLELVSDADNADWVIRCLCCLGLGCLWNWTTNTPSGYIPTSTALGAVSVDGQKLILAGAVSAYTSTDRGITWSVLPAPWLSAQSVESLAMMPHGEIILAGTSQGSVYQSTDFGATWTDVSAVFDPSPTPPGFSAIWSVGMSSDGVKRIAADQTNAVGNVENAGGYVWTSVDSGASWVAQTILGAHHPWDATLSANGTFFVLDHQINDLGSTLWSSTDGTNWTIIATFPRSLNRIAVSGDAQTIVLAATFSIDGNVHLSRDGGTTWVIVSALPTDAWLWLTTSGDGKIIGAVQISDPSGFEVWLSCNNGVTWNRQTVMQDLGFMFNSGGWNNITVSGDGTTVLAGGTNRNTSQGAISIGRRALAHP